MEADDYDSLSPEDKDLILGNAIGAMAHYLHMRGIDDKRTAGLMLEEIYNLQEDLAILKQHIERGNWK